jgi:hypothetical protein
LVSLSIVCYKTNINNRRIKLWTHLQNNYNLTIQASRSTTECTHQPPPPNLEMILHIPLTHPSTTIHSSLSLCRVIARHSKLCGAHFYDCVLWFYYILIFSIWNNYNLEANSWSYCYVEQSSTIECYCQPPPKKMEMIASKLVL